MGEKKQTFETAFTRLESLVSELEKGQIPLEQALELYGEGIELIKYCRQQLERAEQEIVKLKAETNFLDNEESSK